MTIPLTLHQDSSKPVWQVRRACRSSSEAPPTCKLSSILAVSALLVTMPSLLGLPLTVGVCDSVRSLGATNKRAFYDERRVSGLRALVTRAAEGTFLIRLLSEHNLGRLAARSDEGIQRALREPLRLRDWVCSPSGESAASGFISLLISEHRSATGGCSTWLHERSQQCEATLKWGPF